jgi:hypothetical protein
MSYQQLKVQPVQMQQAGAEMQLEMQAKEMQAMDQGGMQQGGAPMEGQPQQPQGEQPPQEEQPMEQSEKKKVPLLEKYKQLKSQQPLEKSVKSYFQEWIDAHNEK